MISIVFHFQIEFFIQVMQPNDPQSKPCPEPSGSGPKLETIISIGVLGWLVIGIVLMGLGIW